MMAKLKKEPRKFCKSCGTEMKREPDCDEFDSNSGVKRYLSYRCHAGSSRSGHSVYLIDLKTGKDAPGWEA